MCTFKRDVYLDHVAWTESWVWWHTGQPSCLNDQSSQYVSSNTLQIVWQRFLTNSPFSCVQIIIFFFNCVSIEIMAVLLLLFTLITFLFVGPMKWKLCKQYLYCKKLVERFITLWLRLGTILDLSFFFLSFLPFSITMIKDGTSV